MMAKIDALLKLARRQPANMKFTDLCRLCDHFFGEPRQKGTSHRVYHTPWIGDPRVNIQGTKGKTKAYQVRQVLAAIEKLKEISNAPTK